MSLPLLPLVVLPAMAPRRVLASIGEGRWRDAKGRLGGLRTGLVAVALISLNHGAYGFLLDVHQGAGVKALAAWGGPALLVALAGLVLRGRWERPSSST